MIQLHSTNAPNKNLQLLLDGSLMFLLLALIAKGLLDRWLLCSAHALTLSTLAILFITSLHWHTSSHQSAYLV